MDWADCHIVPVSHGCRDRGRVHRTMGAGSRACAARRAIRPSGRSRQRSTRSCPTRLRIGVSVREGTRRGKPTLNLSWRPLHWSPVSQHRPGRFVSDLTDYGTAQGGPCTFAPHDSAMSKVPVSAVDFRICSLRTVRERRVMPRSLESTRVPSCRWPLPEAPELRSTAETEGRKNSAEGTRRSRLSDGVPPLPVDCPGDVGTAARPRPLEVDLP